MTQPILITAANDNEDTLECLGVMLESMSVNSPSTSITVYLYNVPLNTAQRIAAINPLADIICKQTYYDGYEPREWMSCIRTKLLLDAMTANPARAVSWIDTDVMIRRDLAPIWEYATGVNTMAITHRPKQRLHAKLATGFVVFSPGFESYNCIKQWYKSTKRPAKWFIDQVTLYKIFMRLAPKLRLRALPEHMHDIHSWHDDSIIWHRRGMHANNLKWLTEANQHAENAHKKVKLT